MRNQIGNAAGRTYIPAMIDRLAPFLCTILIGLATGPAALAQAFDPGPLVAIPGGSAVPDRIGGAPDHLGGVRIEGGSVFGDTVEERAYGREFDDSYLRPEVRRGAEDAGGAAARAIEGRSALDPTAAGEFARQGPAAIGGSAVTRGRSGGSSRAIIRR